MHPPPRASPRPPSSAGFLAEGYNASAGINRNARPASSQRCEAFAVAVVEKRQCLASAPLRVAQSFADQPCEARPVSEGDNEGGGENAQFRDVRHRSALPQI